ncbi:MAG: hypothetical protein KatS3mg104_0310 [Phycisphaerae bacterium]|nr:MAG: hypothetical protein KatS3mg104_0310 [Phycisphaerae bacterium]
MRTPSHSPGVNRVPGPANSRSARLVTTIGIWITLLVVVGACDKNKPVSNPYFGPTLPLGSVN